MRPRLADKFQTNVFPVKKHMKNAAPKNESFSSHWKILQLKESKFEKKKLSSRIIRRSRITSLNAQPLMDSEKRDMATAINHSTADRYLLQLHSGHRFCDRCDHFPYKNKWQGHLGNHFNHPLQPRKKALVHIDPTHSNTAICQLVTSARVVLEIVHLAQHNHNGSHSTR